MDQVTNAAIRDKIVQLYAKDEDAFGCIMYFLDEEENIFGESGISPIWKTFETVMESDELFLLYANRLLEDIKTAEADTQYRISMTKFWSEMMEPLSEVQQDLFYLNEGFENIGIDMGIDAINVCGEFAEACSPIPLESQIKELGGIHKLVFDSSPIFTLEDAVPKPDKKPFSKEKGLDESTKTMIIKKIVELTAEDADAFTRLMYFLNEKDKTYGVNGTAPTLNTLKAAFKKKNLYKNYVDKIVEATKTTKSNLKYKVCMKEISNEWNEQNKPENRVFDEGFEIISGAEGLQNCKACFGLAEASGMITPQAQAKILDWIRQVVIGTEADNEVVSRSVPHKMRGHIAMYDFAAQAVRYNVLENLRRWQKGKISGKMCAKNIIDSIASIGGSIVGVIAGAHFGALLGPAGMAAGGVAGSLLVGHAAMVVSDWLTQKIFLLPKSKLLENGHLITCLGVGMAASNGEINGIYRKRMLEHHKDKSGRPKHHHKRNVIKKGRRQTSS